MAQVTYNIRVKDLHRVEAGLIVGDEAIVSIRDGSHEVHRERFIGVCSSSSGYNRKYQGKPGLKAVLVSGNCRMEFGPSDAAMAAPRRL